MKHIFLVNSFGLKEKTTSVVDKIREVSDTLKIDYEIEVNSDIKSTEDILEDYKDSENIIFAIGGDGIINRVLNSIVGTKNILGYIPYGTGNDFYRCNKELLNQGVNNIDLVQINDKYFINIACFGIDADIANNEDLIHSKFIPKKERYNISLLYNFIKYKAREAKVEIDEDTYLDKYTTIAVCNGRYYGGGYKIAPNSELNDGLVDVYLVRKMPKLSMAKLILGMKKAKHEKSPKVNKIQTDKLTIKSDTEIASNIDGEVFTSKEFNIKVIPKGIKVYYNEELIKLLKD